MCNIGDADDWKVFRSEERRAARPHDCGDCGRPIEKGERYHWATGKLDYWQTFHICAHCMAAGWWLNAVCGGWLYEGIGEETYDHWDQGYTDLTIGRLIVGHRRKWRRWDGSLMPIPRSRRIVWSDSHSTWNRHIVRYEDAA